MRRSRVLALTLGLLAAFSLPGSALGESNKTDVCHLVGNGTYRSINVSENAVEAHLAHGDLLVGGTVTAKCEMLPVPDVAMEGEFANSVGVTTADANGLTYDFSGSVFTDPSLVYVEDLWGEYLLYLPGETVTSFVAVTNFDQSATDTLTLVTTGFVVNLDGSYGEQIIIPSITNSFEIPAAETIYVPVVFQLPNTSKQLNVLVHELYVGDPADGLLLSQLEMVFCPPEMN